jgi:RNA polymerase sigma-70 factor, ECF subfamily
VEAEAEVIARAQNGDADAYAALVQWHQDAVFRLAYLFMGDADDAHDVAQDTFLQAYRALPRFDVARPLRPWLLRICANTARNRRRSWGRYWKMLRRVMRDDPSDVADAESESARHIEHEGLWAALQTLGDTDREVIYLRYFLELSIQETADVLKIEAGTVKSRTNRALTRLREVVKRDFPVLAEGRSLS